MSSSRSADLRPGVAVASAVVAIAVADVQLSLSTSHAFALESVVFLVPAVAALLGMVALCAWAGMRLASATGVLAVSLPTTSFAVLFTVVLCYELLRWRMAGAGPAMFLGLAAVLGVSVVAHLRYRSGFVAVLGAVVPLAGVWAAAGLLQPGGNPTLRLLHSARWVFLDVAGAVAWQAGWFVVVALVWRWSTWPSSARGAAWISTRYLVTLCCAGAVWLAAGHYTLQPSAAIDGILEPAGEASKGLPNILLLVLDTVRADRTDLIDPTLRTTPALLALGQRGAIYTQAYANSTWSLPSHASLFTGLNPHTHGATRRIVDADLRATNLTATGLRIESVPLSDERLTLAELLARQGYETVALSANHGYFSPVFGLLQGFAYADARAKNILTLETVVGPFARRAPEPLNGTYRWLTRSVVDSHEWVSRALAWIDSRAASSAPFFMFMNWADAHDVPATASRLSADELALPDRGVFRRYDAVLRYQDQALGQLVAGLERRRLLEDTLIVVTADHGESLGVVGPGHGGGVRQDQVWIPLAIAGPGVRRGMVDRPVQLTDVAVWLMERGGANVPPGLDGVSLDVPGQVLLENYFAAASDATPVTYANVDQLRPTTWATLDGRWKLVRDARGAERLFDVLADPGELSDLLSEHPDLTARLRKRLDRLLGDAIDRWRLEVVGSWDVDASTRERLRSLGYIR